MVILRRMPGLIIVLALLGSSITFVGQVVAADNDLPLEAEAPPSVVLIEQAYRSGSIDYDTAIEYKVLSIFNPQGLPAEYQSATPAKSGTAILMEVNRNWPVLRSGTRDRLSSYRVGNIARTLLKPTLSGIDPTFSTTHFEIHFTTSGVDAVDTTDLNTNGVPDYIESMGVELENVWTAEVNTMGWLRPPSDVSVDGNSDYDVYVVDMLDYGVTIAENFADQGAAEGDNENSPGVTEVNAAYGYMYLENDYVGFPGTPMDCIRVTAAHEFNHAIQFGYDVFEETWLAEATAVWMEDEVYDAINDNLQYLPDYFNNPDVAMPSETPGAHWYGDWIFPRYTSEHHGGQATVRSIWENSVNYDSQYGYYSFDAIQDALTFIGTSLPTVFRNFAVANYVESTSPANDPYCYEEATSYPSVYIEGDISFSGSMVNYTPSDGVGNYGADYVAVTSTIDEVQITVSGTSSTTTYAATVVGIQSGVPAVTNIPMSGSPASGSVTLGMASYDTVVLVLLNETPDSSSLAMSGYSVQVKLPPNTPPNAPSSPLPANHATGVSADTDLSWTGGDPDAGDTVTYDVYFGTTSSPPLVSDGQSATTYDPGSLAYLTKYYWQIVATDNHGASTAGPAWDLTTQAGANNPPYTPSSPSPANHATGVSTATDLSWIGGDPDAGDTVTYDIYFGTSSSPPLVSNDQPGSTYDPGTLSYNTKYYWYVAATDNHGSANGGPIWDFTTGSAANTPPNMPGSPSPPNHATGISINADIGWIGGDPDAGDTVTYDVYLGTSSSPPLVSNDQSGMAYDPGTLTYNTKYYWKVVATDNHGASVTGPLWDFTTQTGSNQPPSTPTNPSPANHATGVSINHDLSWTGGDPDAGDTVTYDVYFGTSSVPPLVSNDQSATTYDLGTLAYGTTYHWKIAPTDNHGATGGVSVWDFTTEPEPTEPTEVMISPPSQEVIGGDSFSVNVAIDPKVVIAGAQFSLSFDPSLLTANGVTEGNLFKQGGASTYFQTGTINNVAGTITAVAGAITSPGQSVSSPGTFATISFTAKTTVGTSPLGLSGVLVASPQGSAVAITVSDGSVTIGVWDDWDVNMDGWVNVLDMVLVGMHWGETGAVHWIRQDVSRDGEINVLDMIPIGQHWTG